MKGAAIFGDCRERRKPGPFAERQLPRADTHKGAVDALDRHDVADGRKAHKVDDIRARSGSLMPLAAYQAASRKLPVERDEKQERHAGRAKISETGQVSRLIGIDLREGGRMRFDRVMIEHDDIESRTARRLKRRVAAAPQSTVMTRLAPSSFNCSSARADGP